jgi:hypothetical protein
MAKQKLVKKGDQYGILDVASNTVLPISSNMKLVQKQGKYGILDGDSVIPIDEFSQTIGSRDLDILKKKVSTESVSTPTPQVTPSVSPKTPPVSPSVSPAPTPVEQPAEKPIEGSQGKLLIPQKPFYQFKLPPAQQEQAPVQKPIPAPTKVVAEPQQEEIVGSQGKLLIPEKTDKLPAVTETVTTYKNVPVTAPSKNTKNVPLNPELMLQAIAKNEGGRIGVRTSIKGKGTRNTASGTYQITEGTLENIYNKDVDLKKSYDNFQQFKKEFNKNPEVEHQAALSHMADLIKQFGIHALTAWYSPDHAARAAAGSTSALKEIPRRDAGNRISAGNYFKNALSNYKNLLGMQPEQQKTARIPIKQEVVKEGAIEVPSLSKYDVTNPNYYNARGEAYPEAKEIGYMEDLWNRLKGSGAKALAGVLSTPALARSYAEDIVYTAFGLDKEFNKLPSAAKKEVLNTVRTIQANGDLNAAAAVQSQDAFNYLNKKADKIYERTIQQEGDIFTDMGKFKDNPSADNALNIVNRGVRSLVESIPYMATAILPGGNITQGIASAGSKRLEDLSKDGNVGLGYMLASAAHGTAEGFFEAKTNAILKKAGTILRGDSKAVQEFSKGIVKSILKDFNEEGLSEAATTIVQELADKFNKGEDISIGQVFRKAADSYLLGGFAGGGITATAGGIRKAVEGSVAAKTYVANKIMPTEDRKKYDNNLATIQNLTTQKSEDASPEVNQVIDNKIQQLAAENETLFKSSVDVVDNLSNEQLSQVFNIDDELERNYNDAKAIIDDATMDDSAKTLLLNDLLKKQNELKQQRDAIQKQTTSEVPVQPETGARVQMAQGEPQAESQGPTEEVKAEEAVVPEEEFVYETLPEKKEEWIGDFEIIDNREGKADLERQGSNGNWYVRNNITGRTLMAKSKSEAQSIIDDADSYDFGQGETFTRPAQEVKAEEVITPTEEVVTETITPTEPISPQKQTEQTNAVQKGIDAVNKALKRGRPKKEAVQGGIAFMQQTIAYEEADDTTREQMVRDINKQFGVREKKAPTAQKITGQPAPNKVTVQEMAALKDQIKLEARAAKGGATFASDLRKSVIAQVKAFITRGKMSVSQQKSLLNGLQNLNLFNPVMRERFFARMAKMFDRIDYKDRLDEANRFRKQIKKLAKSDTLQDSVRIMANDFAKIIPDFTNIDDFIEKAREVFNAVKTPGIKGKQLSLREAAVIEDISNFTKDALKAQEEKVKNTLLDEYDYLVEAGLIDGKMSLEEIQNYIMDVESGAKELTPDKEAEIRKRVGALFNSMSGIVNSIVETGENPLTGEEVELDSYTKNLIKNFAKMDLSQLDVQDVYRATEALENYLVNGIIDNMDAMYQKYEGALETKKLAEEGVVAQNLKRFGLFGRSNIFARTWAVNISPIKSILDLMFRSREIGSRIFNASGLRDIANATSKVKNEVEKINQAYQNRFAKTKPNGQAFDSAENAYQRGIYAHLKRSLVGTDEEVQKEFDRRKKQVQDTIDSLEKSQDKNLIKKAQIYKKIFDPIKDAKNIKEVEALIDPINKDAVKWRTAIFEKYYPEVKQIAASVYNTILEDDINYSPDVYEKIIEDGEPDVDQKASYKMAFNYLNTERAGTLMKNNRLKSLPKNRVINFDFDYNNSNALAKMLTDIRTAPYVQKYKGFTNSPSFDKIFPDIKDRNVIKERMNWYVNEVRNKNISTASSRTADAAKIFRALSRYGTSRALGGVTSFVKQSVPAMINTTVNLVNNPTALAKGIATMGNKDAQKFISDSGYGIANRGLESQTAIESADQMLEKTDVNSIDKVSEAIGKAGKIYLDNFLKSGDVLAARASWMAYYINKLDQMGENTSNIDWANHTLNKEAADYAEDKVNLQQNVSDTDMLGKFLNTKNPGVTIARSLLLPFSSFIFNAKDKISTDLTILSSNANREEKVNAMKSLAGSAAEMLVFESMSAAISSGIVTAAYAILGYDEDEDEKEARRNKYINMASTRILTDAISPIPNWGDKAVVGLLNKLLNYTQQDLDEEDKKLLYEYKPQDQTDAILGLIGGIPEIATKPAMDITSTVNMIASDVYYDRYGNEISLSPEDKDKLKFVLATEILGLSNAIPNEVLRINQKVKDTIEKENR